MKNKLMKFLSKVGDFIFYSKEDQTKDYKEYMQSFKFGFKLFTQLSLLIIPIVLFIAIVFLSNAILEKTPFYTRTLIVNNVWLAESCKKISTDKNGNVIYEINFKDGSKSTIERKKTEAIYFLGDKTKDGEQFHIKANRQGNDAEMQEVTDTINDRLKSSYSGKEIWENIRKPYGYNEDIYVKYGGLNFMGGTVIGIIVFIGILFCLALYFPIIKAIIRLFKSRKKKG